MWTNGHWDNGGTPTTPDALEFLATIADCPTVWPGVDAGGGDSTATTGYAIPTCYSADSFIFLDGPDRWGWAHGVDPGVGTSCSFVAPVPAERFANEPAQIMGPLTPGAADTFNSAVPLQLIRYEVAMDDDVPCLYRSTQGGLDPLSGLRVGAIHPRRPGDGSSWLAASRICRSCTTR